MFNPYLGRHFYTWSNIHQACQSRDWMLYFICTCMKLFSCFQSFCSMQWLIPTYSLFKFLFNYILVFYRLLKCTHVHIIQCIISVICRQKWTSEFEWCRFGRIYYSTTLDLSALIKAKKYKNKGNQAAAVAACKRSQKMELGTLHKLGSSQWQNLLVYN